MKANERAARDQQILQLWVAGGTYAEIARVVGLSAKQVDRVVKKELAAGAQRRALLTDEALSLFQERHERLFQAHWRPALNGDHKSADLCRRLLDQNARLHGLYADAPSSLPAPTAPLTPRGGDDEGQEEPQDDLARLRSRRHGA